MKMLRTLTCTLLTIHSFAQNNSILWTHTNLTSNFYVGFKIQSEIGSLKVPENRANPNNKNTVDLALLRLKSTNPKTNFPIIFLAGGPGNSGINVARGEMLPIFLKLREIGDVIILDQRGTGQSKPNLSFQEGSFALPLDKTLDSPESQQILLESAKKWAESLQKKGVDIAAYNTVENAEDIEAIRKALGVEKINIWAFSYGTHLALAYFKKYEKNVNKAILGGVNALDDRYRLPIDGDETIQKIAELVKQTPKLNQLIPNIYESTKQLLNQLEKNPITVKRLPFSDQKVNILVGKLDLQVALTTISAQSWFPKDFPTFIYDMEQGKTDFAGFYIRENVKNPRANSSTAMAFSAHCASGVSELRKQMITDQSQTAIFGNAINYPYMAMDFCNIWGSNDLGEEFRKPITSDIPVLFMNGDLDGRTSLKSAIEVAQGFKNGHFITIKNASHDFWMVNSEIPQIMTAFLNNKKVEKTEISDENFEFRSPLEGRIVENLHRKLSKGSLIEMQNEYNSLEPTTYLSSSILASLSNRLVRESKTKEAIDVLTFAVNKYPKNWRFHQSLGDLLSRNGDRELAKQTYKKSLEINPNNLRAEVAISQLE